MRVVFLFSLLLTLRLSAHQEHTHKLQEGMSPLSTADARADGVIEEIKEQYMSTIRPIFESKCFDCHSSKTQFPWYYSLPGINKLIDGDIAEAKRHLDMETGYPFKSHATPQEDIEAIQKSVNDGAPPFRYRMLHLSHGLSAAEKEAISKWTAESLRLIKGSQ